MAVRMFVPRNGADDGVEICCTKRSITTQLEVFVLVVAAADLTYDSDKIPAIEIKLTDDQHPDFAGTSSCSQRTRLILQTPPCLRNDNGYILHSEFGQNLHHTMHLSMSAASWTAPIIRRLICSQVVLAPQPGSGIVELCNRRTLQP
jgi:hypothetical protein